MSKLKPNKLVIAAAIKNGAVGTHTIDKHSGLYLAVRDQGSRVMANSVPAINWR